MDTDTVRKTAALARIRLSEEEVAHYTPELGSILHWVEQLQGVDTDGVPLMSSVADMQLPWREDTVTEGDRRDAVLANAPKAEHGCYLVPKVIE